MNRIYRIADLNVEMDVSCRTQIQSIPYLNMHASNCDKIDIQIDSNYASIKEMFPNLSDSGCEYLATGNSFYKQLVQFDGLMLHSSAIIVDSKAYLFTADKGTGKSTHTSNWRCAYGDERVRILNDDKPALRQIDGVWYAYGTPWCGKTGQNMNSYAPVAGIAEIIRGENDTICPMKRDKAVQLVLKQTCIPSNPDMRLKLLDLIESLVTLIPFWELKCTENPQSAHIAYRAMVEEKENGK